MTCEADEKSVFRFRYSRRLYKMNLQYIVQIRRAHGQPADARYRGIRAVFLNPRLELNQIV